MTTGMKKQFIAKQCNKQFKFISKYERILEVWKHGKAGLITYFTMRYAI